MMRFLSKLKRPRVLLLLVICAAAAGFGTFALLSSVSAKPAFCATCHNMQPEYDSFTHDGYLAKAHADMGVTCHDCHEPTIAQQMKEGSSSRAITRTPCRSTASRTSSVFPVMISKR